MAKIIDKPKDSEVEYTLAIKLLESKLLAQEANVKAREEKLVL